MWIADRLLQFRGPKPLTRFKKEMQVEVSERSNVAKPRKQYVSSNIQAHFHPKTQMGTFRDGSRQ